MFELGINNLEYDITNQKLMSAFQLFDMDGNGTISLAEIQYLLSGIVGSIDCQNKEDMIRKIEEKISEFQGELDFVQFKIIMYTLFLNNP